MHIHDFAAAVFTLRTTLFAPLFLAFTLGCLGADMPQIHGTWVPVKAELGGQPMPDAVLKTITLKLNGGKYDVSVAGEPDKGTYSIDSSTKPLGMVIVGTEGPNKGKSFPAIFELGPDKLRICYDLSGKQRPAEFKSVAGTQLYLVTYLRKKE